MTRIFFQTYFELFILKIMLLFMDIAMANSGIYWIDLVYDFCVMLLIDSARFLEFL